MRSVTVLYILTFIKLVKSNPVVHLPKGSIMGLQTKTYDNTIYYAFMTVPYAAPPVGNLRFMPPQPPNSWNGTLDCTHLNVTCYQLTPHLKTETEDCLYLNVYTPKLLQEQNGTLLPVIFYIHGGGFVDGSSADYHPDFFMPHEVVLVTINYRLGALGFLSTQDTIIPGNNGLKDQQLALEWVHDHINLFGGDPQKVTIFGHSAGSASVGYHLLNPKSQGWFWAAICQSGSVLGTWALQRNPREVAFKFASFLNATYQNSEELLKFLQGVEVEEIIDAAKQYQNYIFDGYTEDVPALEGKFWAPVLEVKSDNTFINEKMYGLLETGKFVRVPLLIGFTTEENLNFHYGVDETAPTMKSFDEDVTKVVPVNMIVDNSTRIQIGQKIKNMYTGGEPFSKNWGHGIRLCSDNDMTRPIMKQAELHSKFTKTYFYVFSYSGSLNFYDSIEGADKVGHYEDMLYIFKCLFINFNCDINQFSAADLVTQRRLTKMWTDFAKFRNPTPEVSTVLQNVTWPELVVTEEKFPYLDIGENLEVKNYPKKDIYTKWKKLYSALNYTNFDTY